MRFAMLLVATAVLCVQPASAATMFTRMDITVQPNDGPAGYSAFKFAGELTTDRLLVPTVRMGTGPQVAYALLDVSPVGYDRFTFVPGNTYVFDFVDGAFFTTGTYHSLGDFNGASATLNVVTGLVPEPATWALMVIGFGIVGAAMRARATRSCFQPSPACN